MLTTLKRGARTVLESANAIRPCHWTALRIAHRQQAARPQPTPPGSQHLHRTIGWIQRAQDAHPSGGVSWGYRLRTPIRSGLSVGWERPYPETTGYIIETMLRYAEASGDPVCRARARRMAEWEIDVQLADGGTQGGMAGARPVAGSTFVTGQVLFGFLAAYAAFGDSRYLDAAWRAGNFLLSCLDSSGRFVRGYSHFCAPGPKAYEARTGWALALLGRATGDQGFLDAARRMAVYALACRRPNGWFHENDLNDNGAPLTHTIGYALEGLWGIGEVLGERSYRIAVLESLDRIRSLIRDDGFLAGRWTAEWQPAVNWSCLTGSAQLAGVFLRAHREHDLVAFRDAARALLGFVTFTQEMAGSDPVLEGGIAGSFPLAGGYGSWCLLNWAAKFYADSVMDWLALEAAVPAKPKTTWALAS